MIVIMRDAVMPECCNTCVCSEGYGCGITGTVMTTKEMGERPDWCPLEEQEPCEDTISRQAAIDEIRKCRFVVDAIEKIRALPSAQPEQTNCEYCHEDRDGYVRPIERNSHAWLVRRGRTIKLRVGFKGEYRECDILFCPMCGRRLADG